MSEFDLSLVSNDTKLVEALQSLFSPAKEKDGDFLTEELMETLEYASIFQPTTRSVDQSGIYESMRMGDVYSKSGVIGNNLSVVILSMWNSRSYYLREKNEQLCSSPNGVTPIHNKFASSCETCRFAKFKRGQPSECTKSINLLVMPANFKHRPYVVQFSRTGYRTGLDMAKQAKMGSEHLYDWTFDLKTERAKDAAYYKFTLGDVRKTSNNLKPAFQAVLNHYRPLVESSISRHETPVEEAEVKKK